jgi:hypothetical protein
MARYWYRICPTCRQGRLFVVKLKEDGPLSLLCEECFCAFDTPAEASDGCNCREGIDQRPIFASQEDISRCRWSEYGLTEAS